MANNIERRTAPVVLEIREDGRTLAGLAVPYGKRAKIGKYFETFAPGAFADADPANVPLLAQHDRESLPIGRALTFTETPEGLQTELRVSETRAGDDVLALVRDRAATGLSIGFTAVEDVWNHERTEVERRRANLVELSVTAFPAYEDARILAVRAEREDARAEWRAHRLTLARWQD